MILLFAVEVELLYHGRGKWISLAVHFVRDDDIEKLNASFLASIKNELYMHLKDARQQDMKSFEYSLCCEVKKADENKDQDPDSLPVIINSSENYEYSPGDTNLYNMFGVPLPADLEEVNIWFEYCTRRSVAKGESMQRQARLSFKYSVRFFAGALRLPNEVSFKLIRAVARLMKGNWIKLLIYLELDRKDVPHYKRNWGDGDDFVLAFSVIGDWKIKQGRNATVKALVTACEKCNVSVSEIEGAYKSEN